MPARPVGQRPNPEETMAANNMQAQTQFGGVSMHGNSGFFPSLFGLQFQQFLPARGANAVMTAAEEQELFLHKALVAMGSVVFLAFLFF